MDDLPKPVPAPMPAYTLDDVRAYARDIYQRRAATRARECSGLTRRDARRTYRA